MSLLTPMESRAFQSFLDAASFPKDWSVQFEISHEHMPPARGREALSKATKDLMSLEGDKWNYPGPPCESLLAAAQRHHHAQAPLALLYSSLQERALNGNIDDAELANLLSMPSGSSDHQLPFYHGATSIADPRRSHPDLHSYDHSSSSSSRQSPVDFLASSSSAARLSSSAKRSPPPDAKSSNKRQRPLSAFPDEHLPPQNRVALLSPSQKKANHIQSEQKRRANIRRGYDALCETIPALREACLVEEEQQLAEGKSKSRRRGKGKGKSDDGERMDGRAGPRSENVVLSKTIDYLHDLISEREILMHRLHLARSALPADHPLLRTQQDAPIPLWERKWTGGEQKGNDDDEDEDDD